MKCIYSLISAGTELAMYTQTHIGFPDPNNTYAKYPFYPGYIVRPEDAEQAYQSLLSEQDKTLAILIDWSDF